MSVNTARTMLKVFGILNIIFGIIGILIGAAALIGGNLVGMGAAGSSGLTQEDAALAAGAAGIILVVGLIALVGAVIKLLQGIFSVGAAKNPAKIMPAFVFAVIGLIMSILSLVITFASGAGAAGASVISGVISLVLSILVFVAANTIRKNA